MQECWVRWEIDKKGNYGEGEIGEETSGDNIHLCSEHEDAWENGEL